MSKQALSLPTHLSIVWGVTLAVLTLIEWRSLDRDPLGQQILLPYIERDLSVHVVTPGANADDIVDPGAQASDDMPLRYEVEFHFNGPLFIACFFLPVFCFHGAGWLLARSRGGGKQ